jgi:hypothetical protein
MARENITAALVGFLMLAVLAYLLLSYCSVSFRCGEGFSIGGLGSPPQAHPADPAAAAKAQAYNRAMANHDVGHRPFSMETASKPYPQHAVTGMGDYAPMVQESQQVATQQAQQDVQQMQARQQQAMASQMAAGELPHRSPRGVQGFAGYGPMWGSP